MTISSFTRQKYRAPCYRQRDDAAYRSAQTGSHLFSTFQRRSFRGVCHCFRQFIHMRNAPHSVFRITTGPKGAGHDCGGRIASRRGHTPSDTVDIGDARPLRCLRDQIGLPTSCLPMFVLSVAQSTHHSLRVGGMIVADPQRIRPHFVSSGLAFSDPTVQGLFGTPIHASCAQLHVPDSFARFACFTTPSAVC